MTAVAEDEQPSPLDEQQEFATASSYQVRDELARLIERDLLGPWDGELEVLPPRSAGPGERYLVGRLGPRHDPQSGTDAAGDAVDTEIAVGGDGADGELPDLLTMQNAGRMWASSMGLSCAVASGVDTLTITASWGRYGKAEVLDEAGNPRRCWSREPAQYVRHVRFGDGATQRIPLTMPDSRRPGVYLAVDIRPRVNGADVGAHVIQLGLVNAQEEPTANKDVAWLFQPRLTVTAAVEQELAVFCPIDDPLDDLAALDQSPEDRHLRLLYRDELRHAIGRNVAVHAHVRPGERHAYRLETSWLPTYEVPATIAPPAEAGSHLNGVELSMDELATAPVGKLAAGLAPLADGYATWLDEQEERVAELPGTLQETARTAIFTARRCACRIRAGIDLVSSPAAAGHEIALQAFRFANEAMALQRRHTTIAAKREADGLSYAEAAEAVQQKGEEVASWRPFQLAFILLNLPALTDPAHRERVPDSHQALVDLLFFPTGGGKTEAYLGLAAYTFAIRRLQKTLGSGTSARSGEGGVAVLMRYTLRLLTAQQFQRAAALVCAAEVVRRSADESGDTRWGTEPFRIGLWVGSAVSPNWYDEAAEQVADVRDAPSSRRTGVLQTLACPWCGTKLLAHRDLRPDDERRRILLYCPSGEEPDPCPFSEMKAPGEGLPILTVDEEIYRYLPSLVIATVDKLAQLPWRGYAGMLFGRVSSRCPRHGYRHDDLDERTGCRGRHNETRLSRLPAVTSQPVTRLRPPDLIIQDELHLISGALGTTVGLFEAAVDELCRWRAGDVLTGPKIVASTATTKRAPRAGARRFRPGPGRVPAAGAGHHRHVLLPAGPGHAGDARPAVPGHLRPRRPAEVRRDPAGGDPADRWADAVRRLRRGRRPVHDRGRLLQRDQGTGRDAAVPGRRRDHPGPHARPQARPVRPDPVHRRDAHDRGAHLPDLLGRHQQRAQAAGNRVHSRSGHVGAAAGDHRRAGRRAQGQAGAAPGRRPLGATRLAGPRPGRRGAGDVDAAGRRGRVPVRADGGDRPAEEHRRVHPGVLPGGPRRREAGPGGDAVQLVPAA